MKKIIAVILLVAMLAMALCACSKTGTCDMCNKTDVSIDSITAQGEEGWFCEDCYPIAEAAAEALEMLGDLGL